MNVPSPDTSASTPDAGPVDLPAPLDLLRPHRRILGCSAVLLPFTDEGDVDWSGFDRLLAQTMEAGLVPAVNMDTGYVNLIDEATQEAVLGRTAATTSNTGTTPGADAPSGMGAFLAGAFVADQPGAPFDPERYRARAERITSAGGTPVIFPSHGLSALPKEAWVGAHATLSEDTGPLVAFELGPMFVPFGRILDLDTYRALLEVPGVIGAKHSSLSRQLEWDRLRLRNEHRSDFHVFTGNDLAIDMVKYGSDYLLGLSAFAPDAFSRRDRAWAEGDPTFFALDDVLQAIGDFAFRAPVPAYKHDAARFLHLRGWITSSAPHPAAPRRPDSDDEVLAALWSRLGEEMGA